MRSVLVFAGLVFTTPMFSQMVRLEADTDDPLLLRFDPEFIRRNNVRSVSGEISVKREGEPMRSRNDRSHYRFDANGLTNYTNRSFGKPGSGRDTASVMWIHDAYGRPVEQLRNDLNGHFALRDSLDAEGRSIRQTYVRISNLSTDRYQLVRGEETLISEERFTYTTVNDSVRTRTWLNDRGLPYRVRTYHNDRWGYLRLIEDHYLVTGRRGRTTFRYAEKGRLAERIEQPDLNAAATTKYEWRYDAAGNVILCDQYRNGQRVRHSEYLYEEHTMFLKAIITKDDETNLIHIERFTTEKR